MAQKVPFSHLSPGDSTKNTAWTECEISFGYTTSSCGAAAIATVQTAAAGTAAASVV
jgi:hypothetical protein